MREIKFRAWDKERKIMIDWDEICQMSMFWLNRESCYVFQQFTGLKDRNGKDLYEGDVIQPYQGKMKAHVAVIKYLDKSFYMVQEEDDTALDCIWYYEFDIIGDIYENPELLK